MPTIYHFTDVDNLDGILGEGLIRCHREADTAVDIGNQAIKTMRQTRAVECAPGGMVCDYVPFYFAPHSPMMCSISYGNVEGVNSDTGRLVYFVSTTEAAYDAGLNCVFTDGNASMNITSFDNDRSNLGTHVDWEIMKQQYWSNTPEDPDRVRRRMAEFLVLQAFPVDIVLGLVVRNGAMLRSVEAAVDAVGAKLPVRRRSDWYF